MKVTLQTILFSVLFSLCLIAAPAKKQPPNIIVIFLDDSAFNDFQPFANPPYSTPNVAKLASEGLRFNQFYVPQAICSASRSALLSGCYPGRTKVFGAHGPKGKGLSPKFATMAEVFKKKNYATAHFGKWHCGDTPETRPLARGFDEHAGLMYSNDMWRHHPVSPKFWGKHPLQYWVNGKVTIEDVDHEHQRQLTTWSTEYAVDFIERHNQSPFFLYLAHSMPHVPLYVSDKFKGKSGAGLLGDVIMELDWSVGQIMKAVEVNKCAENTIIVFSSDNGPWSEYGDHAGTTPFREHKATSFDGGIRSATIIKYPKVFPSGKAFNKPVCSIDLLPTLAHLTGAPLPGNDIDGKNLFPIISGQSEDHPHDYYAFSNGKNFEGVISSDGKWKLHLPHGYRHVLKTGKDGKPGKTTSRKLELSLFNLEIDPGESQNMIEKYPEVAERLQGYAASHRKRYYAKPGK
ncbi:MAG: sulfatase [Planctomycetes bacterium]|nr:sulfatase [Planctomycetota bacterium]